MRISYLAAAAIMTISAGGAFAAPKNQPEPAQSSTVTQPTGSEAVQSGSSDQDAMTRAYEMGMRNSEDSGRAGSDGSGN
jgi:hypothetical protein